MGPIRKEHILCSIQQIVSSKNFDKVRAHSECKDFILDICTSKCSRPGDNREKDCSCFLLIKDDEKKLCMVAEYMLHWSSLKYCEKKNKWIEWMLSSRAMHTGEETRYKFKNGKIFPLPLMSTNNLHLIQDDNVPLICRDALCRIFHIGRQFMRNTNFNQMTETVDRRSMAGKKSNNRLDSTTESNLFEYFNELKEQASPFSTRIVREEVGLLSRDDDPDIILLPPHMTKRRLYDAWCYRMGWMPQLSKRCKGTYKSIKDYEQRDQDDHLQVPLFPTGSMRECVVTWTTFLAFWKRHFPKMRIRSRGADTCTD